MEIEKAVYFCVSVFWRAAVRSWESSSQRYEGIRLGPKYQQEIRAYLLGDAALPENAAVMFIVSGLPRPHLSFNFPDTTRIDSSHAHTLHIPGLTFQWEGSRPPERVKPASFALSFTPYSSARTEMSVFNDKSCE
jgi:hypothetical protein